MATVEHSGSGKEPDRLLELLWRRTRDEPGQGPGQGGRPAARQDAGQGTGQGARLEARPTPGRKPKLTPQRVIRAAVEIADTEGLSAISMSRVARALGVGTMTLYNYVPSKADLIDLMLDEIFLERALPAPGEPRPDGWRAQLALYADRTRAMYRRHPWLCHIFAIRPPAGPGTFAEDEYILSALFGIGLTPRQMARASLAISVFVNTTASIETQSEELERLTGQSHDDWWHNRNRLWEDYFDVERYPAMTYVYTEGGFESGTTKATLNAHEFGFERLLDGIQAVIDGNESAHPPTGELAAADRAARQARANSATDG